MLERECTCCGKRGFDPEQLLIRKQDSPDGRRRLKPVICHRIDDGGGARECGPVEFALRQATA